jgi:hypothetical protein
MPEPRNPDRRRPHSRADRPTRDEIFATYLPVVAGKAEHISLNFVRTDKRSGKAVRQASLDAGPTLKPASTVLEGAGQIADAVLDAVAPGPVSRWGQIDVVSDPRNANAIKPDGKVSAARETLAASSDLTAKWADVVAKGAGVKADGYQYFMATQNSNSAANAILAASGLPKASGVTADGASHWTPAAQQPLCHAPKPSALKAALMAAASALNPISAATAAPKSAPASPQEPAMAVLDNPYLKSAQAAVSDATLAVGLREPTMIERSQMQRGKRDLPLPVQASVKLDAAKKTVGDAASNVLTTLNGPRTTIAQGLNRLSNDMEGRSNVITNTVSDITTAHKPDVTAAVSRALRTAGTAPSGQVNAALGRAASQVGEAIAASSVGRTVGGLNTAYDSAKAGVSQNAWAAATAAAAAAKAGASGVSAAASGAKAKAREYLGSWTDKNGVTRTRKDMSVRKGEAGV